MSFSDAPKRIDPLVPTRNEFHDFPEKEKQSVETTFGASECRTIPVDVNC